MPERRQAEQGGARDFRSKIEEWAIQSGLSKDFIDQDVIWNEGTDTAEVEGQLMLANTEATYLPEGLRLHNDVLVRADQLELKADLEAKGISFLEVEDPRRMAA
jgi:hypothetical protein